MADVAIARCRDYSGVAPALSEALAGRLNWVAPGMKVALKVNLVLGAKPEAAATTHPAVVSALSEMLLARGAEVRVGDSPGGLYTALHVNRVYRASGMKPVEKNGARLNQDFSQREAEFPAAKVLKRFQYTAWLDWADAVIDVCKLKTHGMMGMSGAVKNLFGAIPGTLKPEYHFRYADPMDFARAIVDLCDYVKPRLSIADAVVGMEGNGPTAGAPRFIGAILAAENPHALDLCAAHLIGLGTGDVPTLAVARERNYIPDRAEALKVAGELFQVPDYKNISARHSVEFAHPFGGPLGTLAGKVMKRALRSVPALDRKSCVGCAKCAEICPPCAIAMRGKFPAIDRSKCIRCFCCQEFCPKGAMKVRRTLAARLLNR
ncbi:MAG: DUF362 domain-containing protein [Clostridiales bacterium]|nr:DUF362 domain-containing protein [Clostridiales bacterium]